ncbi:hypothetical protein [Marisediminicola sp. LYQ134]|uniref:hypothetical protein n=1 Tax=Marisediminicola sp. LYQ134 TaxID=3391061 RepID=UPI003983909E
MTVSTTHITQARAGAKVALVSATWEAAREDLERVAELAPDAKIARTNGAYLASFPSGGLIRPISALTQGRGARGHVYDAVDIHPDAVTEELLAEYAPTLLPTFGKITIDGKPTGS